MKKLIGFIGLLWLVVSSCNNEVFIDRVDLPDEVEVTIEGDGGQWSASISRKGLERIYVIASEKDEQYLSYFTQSGTVTDSNVPAKDFGTVFFDNPAEYFSIGLVGDFLYIYSKFNAYPEAKNIILNLEYDYGLTKHIYLTFLPGKQLGCVALYGQEYKIKENIETITFKNSFTNGSSLTQYWDIYPFDTSSWILQVETGQDWANGLPVKMELPAYYGSEWILTREKEITIGNIERERYPFYDNVKITVEIPPYEKATVTYAVNYSEINRTGILDFHNEVSEYSFEESFTCSVISPTSYEYSVSFEQQDF